MQALLFNETQAGSRFFEHLAEVRSRRSPALHVYYTCLSLGLFGQYRMAHPSEHDRLVEDVGREVGRRGRKALSPHGQRPDDRRLREGRSLSWPLAVACLGLSVLAVIALYALITWQGGSATELLQRMARG
jgi:type IV/VI secretion system ImpK/VasF family protein